MKNKNLYLDDLRSISDGFIGVRSYTEFVDYITQNPVGKKNIESLLTNFRRNL